MKYHYFNATHWDREWYEPFRSYRKYPVDTFSVLSEIFAKKTPVDTRAAAGAVKSAGDDGGIAVRMLNKDGRPVSEKRSRPSRRGRCAAASTRRRPEPRSRSKRAFSQWNFCPSARRSGVFPVTDDRSSQSEDFGK